MTRYRVEEPHEQHPGLRLLGRILVWTLVGVLMVALAFIAGLYLWLHESVASVQAHSKDTKEARAVLGDVPPPGHAALALVIGYDRRANENANIPSRSDTVMLIRTDPSNDTVSMMSFPRDLIVNVHCPGQSIFVGKINSAYATCGSKGTVQTVSDLIGLPINYLITVNFRGFKKIVNTLGGVWIDVDRRYFNNNAGLSPTFGYATINLQPGYQKLTGGGALDFVRYRHTDSDLFRVARQQQFVKAMKYQLAHNFGWREALKIVGTMTKNIEVAAGGGGDVSTGTVLSYARFAYDLKPGHFFQTQIQGLTGYSDLRTDPVNVQSAVREFLTPDVHAAGDAANVALGRKVRVRVPTPAETTVTVLNGNGIEGAAGNAAYQLSQRGYHILNPPPAATGNAPRADYFPNKIYYNPSVPQSKAAAKSVANLFAPADVLPLAAVIRPLQQGSMLTVVVGTPWKPDSQIAPAPPPRTPTVREPAHVEANPYDTPLALRDLQKKVGFPLMVPAVIDSSSAPDREKPVYAYRIDGDHKAVRMVFRTSAGAYWGVQETDWDDAPILADKSIHHVLGGRQYDFYFNGPKLHMIVLRERGATYWVVNSLLDNVSNETMIATAKGLRPLKGAK